MEEKLPSLQVAATHFVNRSKGRRRAGDRLRQPSLAFVSRSLSEFAPSRPPSQIRSGGSTSLYKAIYVWLKELGQTSRNNEDDVRRQALIVSLGWRGYSEPRLIRGSADLAKLSESSMYTIGLRGKTPAPGDFARPDFVIRQLSQDTGGRVFFVDKNGRLTGGIQSDCR